MNTCPLCGQPIDPSNPRVWQRVSGWEQKRKGGGTNAIALRRVEQEWAHPGCIMLAKDGRIGQETLL
jgi:hypothetical protein